MKGFFLSESNNIGGTDEVTFYKWKKIGAGCRGGCFWQRICNVVPEKKSARFEREACEVIPAWKPKHRDEDTGRDRGAVPRTDCCTEPAAVDSLTLEFLGKGPWGGKQEQNCQIQ